jgi:hypothetical protein
MLIKAGSDRLESSLATTGLDADDRKASRGDSSPEMEGNENTWNGLLGLRCARLRLDCAWLHTGGVFWKEEGFVFAEAVDRRTGRGPGRRQTV